ncbi:MAG: response regulator transcription factor [Candidatus Omnitrophica bacterium]|nr:response regulator transcription factor [Candidatus Omnitrophota bacterium]MDD5436826.1 response regulator transcription factor [Candidatus Omnitrophota bacterium]
MLKSKKILIVDDEEEFLALLKQALEERGFEVVTATNAVDAGIEIVSSLPALILLDIKMPGIDGLEACEVLKKNPNTKDVPIIVVSALSDESDISDAKKAGVADYFVKPVDMERLIDRVKAIIG